MRHTNRLANKVAFITGSSRGIGRETARYLTAQKASVIINGRNARQLEQTRKQLIADGSSVAAVCGDILSDPLVIANKAIEKFGRVDILINNAALSMRGSFEDTELSVWRKILENNILGCVAITHALLTEIRNRKGAIMFIGSISGLYGFYQAVPYSISKMAITGIAQALRMELANSGTHVGIIYVGFTKNDPDKVIMGSHGDPVSLHRSAHSTQYDVARNIVEAIIRKKKRTVLTPLGHYISFLQRFFPNWLEYRYRLYAKKHSEV